MAPKVRFKFMVTVVRFVKRFIKTNITPINKHYIYSIKLLVMTPEITSLIIIFIFLVIIFSSFVSVKQGTIVVITIFIGEQIGGGAEADENEGISGGAEIIPEIERYLEHVESSFYIIYGGGSGHPHSIVLIVAVGNVIVLRGGCEDFPGEQQSGADIPVVGELVVDG